MLVKITTKHARNSLVTSVTPMQFSVLCDVIFSTKLSRSKKRKKMFFFFIKKDENCVKALAGLKMLFELIS